MIGAIRKFTRRPGDRINVLTAPTHEAYSSNMSECNADIWLFHSPQVKQWEDKYRPLPANHHRLPPGYLPPDIDFDVVWSQNKFGQFQIMAQIANDLQCPLISLEHTLPMPNWSPGQLQQIKQMRGHINLFISEYSRREWGWQEDEAEIIHHGINTDLFDNRNLSREIVCLSVVNDWVNRDWCCGYTPWLHLTKDLPVRVLGDTPGLSRPASSVEELVQTYNTSQVFVNTSTVSPVPTALLESMACGCCPISLATCMIPEIITNGVNGFISNDINELRKYLELCLSNPQLARRIGQAARQTVLERFGQKTFVNNWNAIFERAAQTPFTHLVGV